MRNHTGLSYGLIWPEAGFASIACAATPPVQLSSPAAEAAFLAQAKKVRPPPSSAALRPETGASSIASGLSIAIEAAVVAGSKHSKEKHNG